MHGCCLGWRTLRLAARGFLPRPPRVHPRNLTVNQSIIMRPNSELNPLRWLAVFTFLFSFACTPQAADKKAALSPIYTAKETQEFIALNKAALAALAAGKTPEAVAKLTDLETGWDAQEAKLKPRNEKTWVVIDKTMDQGIAALRGSKVDLAKGKAALEDLLTKLTQATKP